MWLIIEADILLFLSGLLLCLHLNICVQKWHLIDGEVVEGTHELFRIVVDILLVEWEQFIINGTVLYQWCLILHSGLILGRFLLLAEPFQLRL